MNGVAPRDFDGFDESDEPDSPLEAIWERIENWLVENAPMTLLTLNSGATNKDFWASEAALGFPLPAEIRESYRIHNGQSEGTLMDEAQLLSLADMATEYHRRINLLNSNPEFLPLTTEENTYLNAKGQVIHFVQGTKNPYIFDDFTEWLSYFADALEAGEYVWSNDYDGLMRRDEMG